MVFRNRGEAAAAQPLQLLCCSCSRRSRHAGGVGERQRDRNRRLGHAQQGLTRLGDQPRVLHRDDRLCRELFDQFDLLLGKRRRHLEASGDDYSEHLVAFLQRHRQQRTTPFSLASRIIGWSTSAVSSIRGTRLYAKLSRRVDRLAGRWPDILGQ